jgi:hypothetical protein
MELGVPTGCIGEVLFSFHFSFGIGVSHGACISRGVYVKRRPCLRHASHRRISPCRAPHRRTLHSRATYRCISLRACILETCISSACISSSSISSSCISSSCITSSCISPSRISSSCISQGMHVRGMRLRAMHLSGHDNEASAIEEHANSWLQENAFAKIGFRKLGFDTFAP